MSAEARDVPSAADLARDVQGTADAAPVVELLGVHFHALTQQALTARMAEAVDRSQRIVVAHHNLHSVYLFHRDALMRRFHARADVVHADGMPLVWLARALGHPVRREHRVTYVDWIRPLLGEAAKRGWRVFYLGSKPGVATRGAEILRRELPELEIECGHGYFDAKPGSADARAVVERINAFRPQLLLVGMGMPRQEHWIDAHREQLCPNVILCSGACMDYVAQAVPTAPRWLSRLGFEWLFRLCMEPRRLWRRYLLEPGTLLPLLAADLRRRRDASGGSR